MTPRIPPGQRRQEIIEATFRKLVAEGLAGASLRKVAQECGINLGSVRHYFGDHKHLLIAAVTEIGDRMGERLSRHNLATSTAESGVSRIEQLQRLLEEVLPLDQTRRIESIVLLEFIIAARVNPILRPATEQMAVDLRDVIRDSLRTCGIPEPAEEAERLTALIGGLTIDSITPHGSLDPDRVRRTLRTHLESVFQSADSPHETRETQRD